MVRRFWAFGARHLRTNRLPLLVGGIFLIVLIFLHNFLEYVEESEYRQYFLSKSKYDIVVGDIPFVIENKPKCRTPKGVLETVYLLLIVKSAVNHTDRRSVIRLTWGWEKRFPGVVIRRVFNLGIRDNASTQQLIEKEQWQHGDIIQGSFVDTYYNNTLKTLMGFRWAVQNCPTAKFVMFVDDDEYVSIKNVLEFISHPRDYPSRDQYNHKELLDPTRQFHILDGNQSRTDFYAGYVFPALYAQRDHDSKWYIPESEYPFTYYPPFVAADAIIFSYSTLRKLYYASAFVKQINFDDVYLGIVAKIAGVSPYHNSYFRNKFKPVSSEAYQYVISSHGFENPDELINTWTVQFTRGIA